jgi:hypothetical protein
MKTSKIIFISFFSFVGLLLLSFMIFGFIFNDIAIKEYRKKLMDKGTKTYKIEKPFKHIFVKNKGFIKITEGAEQLLRSYSYTIKDSLVVPVYKVQNDTLFVDLHNEISTILELNNLENLISISGFKSNVHLSLLNLSSLKLNFTSGNIRIGKNVNISKLDINLNDNSVFSANQLLNVDSLSLNINKSSFEVYNKKRFTSVKGSIANNSNVRLPKALHIDLDIDKTSKVRM